MLAPFARSSSENSTAAEAAIPRFAPGCFGSAVSFSADDPTCGRCAFADRCGSASGRTAAIVRQMFADSGALTRAERKSAAEAASRAKSDAAAGIVRRDKADLSGLTAEERAERRRLQQRASKLRRKLEKGLAT